jgi:ParB family chromosome partitioning protein
MDRENRQRADLRPFEQGDMYRRALDEGLFTSLRKMCEALGTHPGHASAAIKVARFPIEVLDAFASRLDIQFRWSVPISNALETNPDALIAAAKEIADERAKGSTVSSTDVFNRLIAKPVAKPNFREVDFGGKLPMKIIQTDEKLTLELHGIDSKVVAALEKAILAVLK